MEKIKVYKTYNAADMADCQPHIFATLRALPGFAAGKLDFDLSPTGTWTATATTRLAQKIPKPNLPKTAAEAFDKAKQWMEKFDSRYALNKIAKELPHALFDAEWMEVSATPVVEELYGSKVTLLWQCRFKPMLRPSSSEKPVVVGNTELQLTLCAGGDVVAIRYGWLPVREEVGADRVKINNENNTADFTLAIQYEMDELQNLILPTYFITEKKETQDDLLL